ncbi:hypothetical protein PMIN03_008270 [Paraphaeosphaeria minitans]
MIRQRQALFLDVALVEGNVDLEELPSTLSPSLDVAGATVGSVPPFYHWPTALSKDEMSVGVRAMDEKYATKCLEKMEHAMLNITLAGYADGPVQQTFTSTKYYESLHENTFENVESLIFAQVHKTDSGSTQAQRTHHQILVRGQSPKLPSKAHVLAQVMHHTLGLFVKDVNEAVLMREVWGAVANIAAVVENLSIHQGYDPDSKEYTDPGWKTPKTKTRAWRIQDDKDFGATLKRCRRCACEKPFHEPDAALEHLQKHAEAEATLLESTMAGAGAGAILDRAIEEARKIYEELKELADGVRNEKGDLSDLYSFPRKLLEALHRLIVFYFAVERSLHFTEECFNETKKGGYQDYPYTDAGLEILNGFRESAKSFVLQAREELCDMVRSTTPNDTMERLSWGADSISKTQLVTIYLTVLDDATYPADLPSRRDLYPYERLLLNSCLDNLALNREENDDQIRRCGPLSNNTKQSAEINEDHGKFILVFTVMTVIFLPLSFVTSYLGMNTSDIRDMENKQSLFWEIALPLTAGIMAIMLAIAYNGDEIRDYADSLYRAVTGRQGRRLSARRISVLQRKRAAKGSADSATPLIMADDAEYLAPQVRPDYEAMHNNAWDRTRKTMQTHVIINNAQYREEFDSLPQTRLARSSRITALERRAFPEAVPYAEPISYTESPFEHSVPPLKIFTRTPMSQKLVLQNSYSRHDRTPPPPPPPPPSSPPPSPPPPPPPPREQLTFIRIHKKHIVPSVLNAAHLPWAYDDMDPEYIIIRRNLQQWETDKLFEQSKDVIEGWRKSDARAIGGYGGARVGSEYVWTSKKE